MTPFGTILATFFSGKLVGTDEFGNRYYVQRYGARHWTRPKRWVIYKGAAEPSKVPPHWHGWLHYTHDVPVTSKKYGWQKEHLPNLTGTVNRYQPPGHADKGGVRPKATADYTPWNPHA